METGEPGSFLTTLPEDIAGATAERLLGRGASGTVELVRMPDASRYALKRLSGDWQDPAVVARFRREARVVARLNHPNVVRARGGIDDAGAWLLMEYVAGPTLTHVLRERAPSTAESLTVLEGLCAGVAHAHEQRIVHRDINPNNVLLDDRGSAKLVDFGVATMIGDENQLSLLTFRTRPGALLGTPSYMCPEAAAGSTEVTPLWDVYSLGMLAYRLLAGVLPFDTAGGPVAILQAHLREPVPDPATLGAHLPRDVTATVLHALAKSPDVRTGSVAELWQELSTVADAAWPLWRTEPSRISVPVIPAASVKGVQALDESTELGLLDSPEIGQDSIEPQGDTVHAERPAPAATPLAPTAPLHATVTNKIALPVFVPKKRRHWPAMTAAVAAGLAVAFAVALVTHHGSAPAVDAPGIEEVELTLSGPPATYVSCPVTLPVVVHVATNGAGGKLTYGFRLGGRADGPLSTVVVAADQRLVDLTRSVPVSLQRGTAELVVDVESSATSGTASVPLPSSCTSTTLPP
jgi:serine/threonine protein kinase